MKYFLIALLTIFTLQACGDNPTEPDNEFEPYRIGAFELVSNNEANWVGEESNLKTLAKTSAEGDTIEIKQPGQRALKLWQADNQETGQFTMQFTDSTMTKSDIDGDIRDIVPRFYNPEGDGGYPIGMNGYGLELGENHMQLKPTMLFNCGSNFSSNNPIIHIRFIYRDSEEHIRTYAVFVDGIIETVSEITCD